MKKKLIFAIHRLSKNGGASRCVYELAKRAREDFDVIIITLDLDKNLDLGNIKLIVLKKPKLPKFLGQIIGTLRISKKCKELKNKYGRDCIIHSQGNVSLYSDIVTCQGCYKTWFKYQINYEKNIFKKILKSINISSIIPIFLEKKIYKFSNKVLSISCLTKKNILDGVFFASCLNI